MDVSQIHFAERYMYIVWLHLYAILEKAKP